MCALLKVAVAYKELFDGTFKGYPSGVRLGAAEKEHLAQEASLDMLLRLGHMDPVSGRGPKRALPEGVRRQIALAYVEQYRSWRLGASRCRSSAHFRCTLQELHGFPAGDHGIIHLDARASIKEAMAT